MNVTVLTPSVAERAVMLGQCMASVAAQTERPFAHLVAVDLLRLGASVQLNHLLTSVTTEWAMVLDDYDLIDPNHLATLLEHSGEADVVYTYCRSVGPRQWPHYNQPFDPRLLERRSVVSHTALFRTEWARKVGGWANTRNYDWRFWQSMLAEGARIRSVPEITWTYRLLGNNQSFGERSA